MKLWSLWHSSEFANKLCNPVCQKLCETRCDAICQNWLVWSVSCFFALFPLGASGRASELWVLWCSPVMWGLMWEWYIHFDWFVVLRDRQLSFYWLQKTKAVKVMTNTTGEGIIMMLERKVCRLVLSPDKCFFSRIILSLILYTRVK